MRKLKITELNRISAEEFKQVEKLPLVVVLDDIRSLHNIGSVFRTSDAFRIECARCGARPRAPPLDPARFFVKKRGKKLLLGEISANPSPSPLGRVMK